jgi:hypothetical protein
MESEVRRGFDIDHKCSSLSHQNLLYFLHAFFSSSQLSDIEIHLLQMLIYCCWVLLLLILLSFDGWQLGYGRVYYSTHMDIY